MDLFAIVIGQVQAGKLTAEEAERTLEVAHRLFCDAILTASKRGAHTEFVQWLETMMVEISETLTKLKKLKEFME